MIIAANTASLPRTGAQRKTTSNKLMQVNNLDHDRDDETPQQTESSGLQCKVRRLCASNADSHTAFVQIRC